MGRGRNGWKRDGCKGNMNRCPITYQLCGEQKYSKEGLRLLSPRLQNLKDFPFGEEEQLELALKYADKLSFSGVQRKLNAHLAISTEMFEVVPRRGNFIIKPQSPDYSELPQNEDLTMKLADCVGIDTPLHGLMYCSDGSLSYFIKRFDRKGKGKRLGSKILPSLQALRERQNTISAWNGSFHWSNDCVHFPLLKKESCFF